MLCNLNRLTFHIRSAWWAHEFNFAYRCFYAIFKIKFSPIILLNRLSECHVSRYYNFVQSRDQAGRDKVGGDGRVDVPDAPLKNLHGTYNWIRAENAPRWQTMPEAFAGEGFFNFELSDTTDNHDFGTDWMANTIISAGWHYNDNYLSTHSDAALLTVNDVSLEQGGDTMDHKGHESGMACDIRLPHVNGKAPGGIRFDHKDAYDQSAMRAMLQALKQQPLVEKIIFNDPKLVAENLCIPDPSGVHTHDDHGHFELKPLLPIIDYTQPISELFDQAILFFNRNSTIDPQPFRLTTEGFQDYLDAIGVNHFSASEMVTPRHPDVAAKLGYSIFLPPHDWWSRGAALALLSSVLRELVGEPVHMRNWWRPRPYNNDETKVEGATDSEHIAAYAVDLDFRSPESRKIAEDHILELAAQETWLELSIGLGNQSIHFGMFPPRGGRRWTYASHPDHTS